ncbi:MAG: VWA domain-containing protein [Anaerolineae bacterium]|nr:VWA domain-containing protein [Anaerolineae bacterium]
MSAGNSIIRFSISPEATLVPSRGDSRYVDFHLRADATRHPVTERDRQRLPLSLGLVLDRSGSMSGAKIETAKRAVLQVLARLNEHDRVSLVIFDDHIDVLQPSTAATDALKWHLSQQLARVHARGSTALHEGWLTGCHSIADDDPGRSLGRPARVFLLTDGLANVGQTDPETIASEAAQIHVRTGITTSTFGIGSDYDEGLLGPMAVAGGGQFHHLRHPDDILSTFAGELGALLHTVATGVSLEVEVGSGVDFEVVSAYWAERTSPTGGWRVTVGDLTAGEERHLVARLRLPPGSQRSAQRIRARVTWTSGGVAQQGSWQELAFTYASEQEAEREQRDRGVIHWAGLHESARARQRASYLNQQGDTNAAGDLLRKTSAMIAAMAADDAELTQAVRDLRDLSDRVSTPMSPDVAKEMSFVSQAFSRGQRDYRQPKRRPQGKPK